MHYSFKVVESKDLIDTLQLAQSDYSCIACNCLKGMEIAVNIIRSPHSLVILKYLESIT